MNEVQQRIEREAQKLSRMNERCTFTAKDGSLILGLLRSVNKSFRGDSEGQYEW